MFQPPFKPQPPLGPPKPTARQRVLAQWHGVDLAPLETARMQAAQSAGMVLPKVLSEVHLDRRRMEAELYKAWNALLDPNIVAHAQPVGLKNGTLFVNVDSSVWLSEIVRYRRREILERLQSCFGREFVARISFRLG